MYLVYYQGVEERIPRTVAVRSTQKLALKRAKQLALVEVRQAHDDYKTKWEAVKRTEQDKPGFDVVRARDGKWECCYWVRLILDHDYES